MQRLTEQEIMAIRRLRQIGRTVEEIAAIVQRSERTVRRYLRFGSAEADKLRGESEGDSS